MSLYRLAVFFLFFFFFFFKQKTAYEMLRSLVGSVDWSKLGGSQKAANVNYQLGSYFGDLDAKSTTMVP